MTLEVRDHNGNSNSYINCIETTVSTLGTNGYVTSECVQLEGVTRLRGSGDAQRLQRILQIFDLILQPLSLIRQSRHIHYRQSGLSEGKQTKTTQRKMNSLIYIVAVKVQASYVPNCYFSGFK